MTEAYANELESWFSSFPSIVQHPLRSIVHAMTEHLRWVSGDPQELVRAGETYARIGENVNQLAQQLVHDRSALAEHWNGSAHDSFVTRVKEIEGKLGSLGESTKKTKDLLGAAAQAVTDGVNTITDIIVTVLSRILSDAAIHAALSFFSGGASLAALIARWISEGVAALQKISSVVGSVVGVFEKITQFLGKLGDIVKTVEQYFNELKEILTALKGGHGAATGTSANASASAIQAGATSTGSSAVEGSGAGNDGSSSAHDGGWSAVAADYRNASRAADRAVNAVN